MKTISHIFAALGVCTLLASSCTKVLDEQPRTFFEPGYFSTEAGVQGGLTALYASLRYYYGQAYYYNINTTGTDEATYGQSADGNFKNADMSGAGTLTPSSSRSDVLWGVYTYINTASGIIENAEAVGLNAALIAEARFFRAWYYFQLVQTFGGVPLDLGSGELAFNSTPTRSSVRNTVPEVYQKAIFADLAAAVSALPDTPRLEGCVTKNVARLVLAKAYLTFGWWLENPKNIPTYPACERKDLDGHDAQWYFKQSYDLCQAAIAQPGPYGLCDTFYEVNLAQNDRNKEIMLYADHTQESQQYNGGSLTYSGGGAPDNFSGWMINWNHGQLNIGGIGLVAREASQEVGRPWTRMAPTHEVIKIFTSQDIEKDSRFDGTFTTRYYGTWNKSGKTNASVVGANGMDIKLGECVLSFVPEVIEGIVYPGRATNKDGANVGGGTVPGRADYVMDLTAFSRVCYPALWKLGCYRSDYDKATQTGSPNAASTRPYSVLKFSDFYLTAAEAAFKMGDNSAARSMIQVLRRRAGVWKHRNNDRVDYAADFSEEMAASTPETITLDYILDERMREFYGEGFRWFDLVRTQTWRERAGSYTISGTAWGSHTPETFSRTIEDYHYLRPIPQSQLDGMEMTREEKAAYQNPGYPTE